MNDKKPILIFGAGCIGRGLLGERAAAEERPFVLVEAVEEFADALKKAGYCTVELVGRDYKKTELRPFDVLTLKDTEAIFQTLENCAVAATAVGGMHLEGLAARIAPMLMRRDTPLNILVCENWPKADYVLTEALLAVGVPSGQFSCIPCSVERMVKAVPNSLNLLGEYGESAWMDGSKWIGDEPLPAGLNGCDDLAPYYARKLYTNNAGHALLAYEGFRAGVATLPEAMDVPAIRERLAEQLHVAAQMLTLEFGLTEQSLEEHLDSLVRYRFSNRHLADEVERVARQPLRKLGPNERLVGLLRKLERHELPTRSVCRTIVAAMCYAQSGDDESEKLQEMIRTGGAESVLRTVCGLTPDEEVFRTCMEEWKKVSESTDKKRGEKK